MPPPTAQPIGRRGGGGGGASGLPTFKQHALMKGVTGIVMEHESHSFRQKRSRGGSSSGGGAAPPGMSPGGTVAAAAPAAAPTSTVVAAGAAGGVRGLRKQQPAAQRHFAIDFREPDQMEDFRAQRLQRKFREKLGAKTAKYELVAGFHLDEGVIISYHPFRTRVHFELTERRRKLLARYYRRGQQEVLLYVDRSEFEYYSPVCCYQPPKSPPGESAPAGTAKRRAKGSATSCFAIAGCAS